MRVLFICRGNMFRSQIATAIYNKLSHDGTIAEGYGTAVAQEGREGRLLSSYPELSIELEYMKEKDMDIANCCCKQITPEILNDASQVFLMSEPEFVPDWLRRYPHTFWEVPNPTTHTHEIVDDVYQLLWEKIRALIPYEVKKGLVQCSQCRSWNTQSIPGIAFSCNNCGHSASTAWD